MDKRRHRIATAVLSSLAGLSALLAATDPASLDVSSEAFAWCAVVLAAASVVVTAIRQALDTEA